MSIFEGLKPVEQKQSSIFEGLSPVEQTEQPVEAPQESMQVASQEPVDKTVEEIKPKVEETEKNESEILSWVSREITKPAYKGLAGIPDVPVALGNLILTGINKFAGTNIPLGKYPSDYVGEAVDKVTGGLSEGEPGVIGKGIEFASSMASGGGVAKALNEGSKVAPFLGSTKGKDVATAGAIGSATQFAEDTGADPLTAAGVGLGVGVLPGAAKSALKGAASKSKSFNKEVYDAAQKQDITLPRVALDSSKKTRIAQTAGEHSIIAAGMLEKEAKHVKKSFHDAVERNLNKTSKKKNIVNQKARDDLYHESKGRLKDTDVIYPEHSKKSFEDARKTITETPLVASTKEKEHLQQLDKLKNSLYKEQLSSIIGKDGKPIKLQDYKNAHSAGEVSVKKLIIQKERLNKQISKLPESEWVLKDQLVKVRNALNDDIGAYAKKNSKFGEKWYAAEKLHADMAKRGELDKTLKLKEHVHPELTYEPKKLAENYLNVRSDKKFIKLIGGEENLKHWDDIVTAARSLPHSKISTLAKNMKIMTLIGAATGAATGFVTAGSTGLAGGITGSLMMDKAVGKYLTNKTVISKLAQYAKQPTEANAKILNNTFKSRFGVSVQQVASEIEKSENKE